MRPRTVAMVAACPYPSGQGTQALIGEMARGLARRGHRVHLICYHHAAFGRDEPFALERIPALPFYRRLRSGPDAVKPLLDALLVARCVQVIRRQGCDLVHAHNYEGALAGYLAAQISAIPLLYHAHNLMEDELPRYFSRPLSRGLARGAGWALDRLVPRLGQRVIALHAGQAAALRRLGVAARRLRVVEPGIDLDFWAPPASPWRDPHQVAYCGNLDRYQNLPLLFAAMARVVARLPAARLVLATPNDPEEARRLIAARGATGHARVQFAPDAAASREVLWASALAVCPRSSASGFPLKNLNAAAAGLPVVACRGGGSGVVDGQSGLLVEDDDPDALAAAIVGILQNPARGTMLGQGGLDLVRARHAVDIMTAGVEAVWDDLLGGPKKGSGN